MKKKWPLILGIVFFILLLVGSFLWWRGKRAKEALPVPVQERQLIETPLEERPYVTLTPRTDGREFTLKITRIKNATTIDYELVYLTQGLPRGVVGTVDLKGETAYSKKLLFGTCSRGVCKYDEDVTEGDLTMKFRGAEGVRKFISDFHLQQGDDELTSKDGNFKLEGKLSPGTFYLTMTTIGLPQEFVGQVVGGPYGVFTAGSKLIKNGKVTFSLSEEISSAKIYAWTGQTWEEVEEGFEIEDKLISAEVDSLATFIAVASE